VEPYLAIAVDPGHEFTWRISYLYNTIPPDRR
jgi:hypothetical protein